MGLKMGFVSTLFSRPTNGECLPTSVDACKTTDRSTFVRSFVSPPMGGRKNAILPGDGGRTSWERKQNRIKMMVLSSVVGV